MKCIIKGNLQLNERLLNTKYDRFVVVAVLIIIVLRLYS